MGLDGTLWGEENGGSPNNIGITFPVKGGEIEPKEWLFSWVRRNSRGEVGIFNRRHGAKLKKKNGVRVFGSRVELWEVIEEVGLVNQAEVVNQG